MCIKHFNSYDEFTLPLIFISNAPRSAFTSQILRSYTISHVYKDQLKKYKHWFNEAGGSLYRWFARQVWLPCLNLQNVRSISNDKFGCKSISLPAVKHEARGVQQSTTDPDFASEHPQLPPCFQPQNGEVLLDPQPHRRLAEVLVCPLHLAQSVLEQRHTLAINHTIYHITNPISTSRNEITKTYELSYIIL